MTPSELLKSDPRAFDAAVAEKVFGWTETAIHADQKTYSGKIPGKDYYEIAPNFSERCTADYSVLEEVRGKWIFSQRRAFQRNLEVLGNARLLTAPGRVATPEDATTKFDPMELWMQYQVGDYSLAALMVLDQSASAGKMMEGER